MTMTSEPSHCVSGIAAFEILFHETSHHVFGFRHGYVAELIREAARDLDTRIPRNLSHALSFYTTGHVLGAIVDEDVVFEPYWQAGVMERAWPNYLKPIDTHCAPH